MGKPQNAIGFVRLSELRAADMDEDGQGKGNVDQKARIRLRAKALGWVLGLIIVENDLSPGRGKNRNASAFKRRKIRLPNGRVELRTVRPGFRQALDLLAGGKNDGFLALDLDRTVRDPRDLEDMIDVVEEHSVPVESVTGSLRLSNDGEITMARVLVAVANKESRDKARRVAAARERQAMAGEYGGGRRPFGFCAGPPEVPEGAMPEDVVCEWHGGRTCKAGISTISAETDVVKDCSRRLLQGVSLRSLAAELREGTVPTVTGAQWSAETLREILLRPRNAGFIVYRGEIMEGVKAPWDPIVSPEVFEAMRVKLTDPSRRTGPGAAPRWLGSGVFRCGICTPLGSTADKPVTCEVIGGGRAPRYKCKEHNHLTRNVEQVDRVVFAHVMYALTHDRGYELLAKPAPDVDVEALRAERAAIRTNLEQMAADRALNLVSRAQLIAATKRGNDRIEEIDKLLDSTVSDDPLAEVLNSADPVATWLGLPRSNQRVIVDRLCTVTILPSGRRGRRFDLSTVRVVEKHHLGPLPAAA